MGHQNIFTPHKKDNIIFLPLANRTTQYFTPFLMGHQKIESFHLYLFYSNQCFYHFYVIFQPFLSFLRHFSYRLIESLFAVFFYWLLTFSRELCMNVMGNRGFYMACTKANKILHSEAHANK